MDTPFEFGELSVDERELRVKFAPVLKDILILGHIPFEYEIIFHYAKKCAMNKKCLFPSGSFIFFCDIYNNYTEVVNWVHSTVPKDGTYKPGILVTGALEPWSYWEEDRKKKYIILWDDIYKIAEGIFNVLRGNK